MKSAITTILIFGLAITAFFGVFSIGCDGGGCTDDAHSWCFAAQAEAAPCPSNANSGSFLNFHLGALKIFSSAVFGEYIRAAFMAALAFVFIIASAAYEIAVGGYMTPAMAYSRRSDSVPRFFSSARKFYRWLARHENSPAYF